MILFKPESKAKILAGAKRQTRKLWDRPRAKEGAEHLLYLRPPITGEKPFARVLITRVWRERLADMSEADAVAEGYADKAAFLAQFARINNAKLKGRPLGDILVYAVEFKLLETL
jgi:hypothetical protein